MTMPQDIAIVTGAEFVAKDLGMNVETTGPESLGIVRKVPVLPADAPPPTTAHHLYYKRCCIWTHGKHVGTTRANVLQCRE